MPHHTLCCASSLEGGGSERQLWQLACGLSRDYFNPQIFVLYRRGDYLSSLPADALVHAWDDSQSHSKLYSKHSKYSAEGNSQSGTNHRGRPINKLHPFRGWWTSRWFPGSIHRHQVQYLTQIIEKNQIEIVYDRGYHCTLVTESACRNAKVARVSAIVSPPSRDFWLSNERWKSLKYRRLRRAYSDHRAVTIAVSQSVAEDAIDFFRVPPERVRVLPSPVDVEAVHAAAGLEAAKPNRTAGTPRIDLFKHSNDKFRIALIGRMTAEKGHAFLLESAAYWRDRFGSGSRNCSRGGGAGAGAGGNARGSEESRGTLQSAFNERLLEIDFLGDGPLMGEITQLARRLGLQKCIQFHGHQGNPYPQMLAADVVCIPSRYEGLSNVALEAMALGIPVVASAASQMQQLLGRHNERGIVLKSDTTAELAQALQRLMNQPELSAQISNAAYQWVVQHHSLNSWLVQMQEILLESRLLISAGSRL